MLCLILLRLALLVGVVAGTAVADPTAGGPPALLLAGLALLLVAGALGHRELHGALGTATSSLVRVLTFVVAPRPSVSVLEASVRRRRIELARRGACRRLQLPDVPGKPQARAPGPA